MVVVVVEAAQEIEMRFGEGEEGRGRTLKWEVEMEDLRWWRGGF